MEDTAHASVRIALGCSSNSFNVLFSEGDWQRARHSLTSAPSMNAPVKPLQVVVYQDVLCGWCYLLERRLAPLKEEFKNQVVWRIRPYPLRPVERALSAKDLDEWQHELERARKEPEGTALTPDLWSGPDLPLSSLPPLIALEAARLQGPNLRERLAAAMQRAALESGINVTRSDIIFELAAREGLEMNRFAAVFQSPETKRLILQEHELAEERGVKGVPTLVVNGKWMISGLRDVSEYREHLLSCLQKVSTRDEPSSSLH